VHDKYVAEKVYWMCQAPGTRYQVPGTRYQVPGTRYQVPGTRYQVPGTRYQEHLVNLLRGALVMPLGEKFKF